MKQSILIFTIILTTLLSKAQVITPSLNSEYCPGVDITFTVTIGGQSVQSVTPKALNVPPTVVQQPFNISVNGGNVTFSFAGRFSDYNNKQTFTVNYTNTSGSQVTWDATFVKIKSLKTANSFSQIYPSPTSITAQRCEIQSFNINFSNVQYGNPFEAPPIGYGMVTNYEYLLPAGWSLNGTPSTGNWMQGNNNVTVTSDLSSGVSGSIRIRPENTQCAAGLQHGQEASVAISRPAPTLTITGSQDYICNSNCATYTLNGMPSGATVQWGLSNTSEAAISGCSTCPTVTMCKTGTGNAVVTLTATVTHCSPFVYTKTYDISLGKPQPNPIVEVLVDPYVGKIQVESLPALPGATYNWYKDGVLVIGQHGSAATIPIRRNVCAVGYGIEAEAINACGTSARTYKGVYVPPCDGYYTASPNPATSGEVTVAVNERTKNADTKPIELVRVYDVQGNLKKQQTYIKVKTATLNISQLPNGTYYIEVASGSYKEQLQLIIQK